MQAEQTAILRSVEGEGADAFEHWRMEEPLATGSETGVSPGEPVEVPFSLNVSEQIATAEEIEAELGGTPGETELLVVSELLVDGVKNDAEITDTYVYETTIDVDGNVYRFDGEGPHEESGEQLDEREVEATHGLLRSAAGPVLVALGLIGIVGLAIGRYQGTLTVSRAEREWLAYRTTYREFDKWISTGHIADDALPSSRVALDSLDGLVDVAIDSNRRVIHDRRRNSHLVIVDDTVYTYDPPAPPSPGLSPLEPSAETTQSLPGETTQSPSEEATQSPSEEGTQSPSEEGREPPAEETAQSQSSAEETGEDVTATDESTAEPTGETDERE